MASRKWMVVVSLVSCLVLVGGGCSWMMVRPVEPTYSPSEAERPPECTAGQAPPILDTLDVVGSVGTAVTGAVWTAQASRRDSASAVGPATLGIGVLSTLLYSMSAGHGFSETARCRRMRNQFQANMKDRAESGDESDDRGVASPEAGGEEKSLADKEILTIVEAAEMCGVERSVIREGLSSGELEGLQTDRGYELPRAEVVKYCSGLDGE